MLFLECLKLRFWITLMSVFSSYSITANPVDFTDAEELDRWVVVLDGVMGGRSSGGISFNDGDAFFSGSLSLANNGGFASVRRVWPQTVGGNDRVVIKVLGDGRKYQLRLRQDRRFNGIAYAVEFKTIAEQWLEFEFSAEDFSAVYFGRLVRGAAPLELDNVKQVGFLIADKRPGDFKLQIDSLSMIKQDRPDL